MIEFTGYITMTVSPAREQVTDLDALAKQVMHDFPACQNHFLKITTSHTQITFLVPGEADNEDEAAQMIRDYARMIYNAFSYEFLTYTSAGKYDLIPQAV